MVVVLANYLIKYQPFFAYIDNICYYDMSEAFHDSNHGVGASYGEAPTEQTDLELLLDKSRHFRVRAEMRRKFGGFALGGSISTTLLAVSFICEAVCNNTSDEFGVYNGCASAILGATSAVLFSRSIALDNTADVFLVAGLQTRYEQ